MKKIQDIERKLKFIKTIINENAKISYGGTSSGIIALASAKAAQLLKSKVFYTTVFVSPLIYINSAHIGVPGLGVCGMKKLVAAGLVSKKPELGLHVLQSLTKKDIEKVDELTKNPTLVNVEVQYNQDLIYCRVIAVDDKSNVADVKIEYSPTYFTSIKFNSKETVDALRAEKRIKKSGFDTMQQVTDYICIKDAYELVKHFKLKDLQFIDEHIKINKNICELGAKEAKKDTIYSQYVKTTYAYLSNHPKYVGNDFWMVEICTKVIAGINARMTGLQCPTMTAGTNGDHGIVAVMVPYYYAQIFRIPKEKLYQAIALAHFITWRIGEKIGKLTIMCGTAIAAIAGAIAAVAYMKDEKWELVERFLNLHLCQQAGTLCFGSSASCTLKILAALTAGFYCLEYAQFGGHVPAKDGIIDETIAKTLNNLDKYTSGTNDQGTIPIVESFQKEEEAK